MSAVIEKIENILTSEYSTNNYVALASEILEGMSVVAPDRKRKEFSNFSSHIESSAHIGNYADPDGKKIIVLAVELKNSTYVENSRSTQRSYAKKLIENANADAALIAFYTVGDSRWRLSLVRLDYELKIENGKLKTAENMTPARRYSFLVGKDEPCHTAIDRFRAYLENYDSAPTLDNLENAFSVEAVTKEFFELYCEKFLQLRECLENNQDFIEEAKLHNYTSEQFAKKTMGQIVFLYFLQKKGWLGVKAWPRSLTASEYKKAFFSRGTKSRELIPKVYKQVSADEYRIDGAAIDTLSNEDETFLSTCVKGEPWGSGPHNFMRKLFELAERKGANFFDDFLEPLFYDALNVNRGDQGYDPALHCRIPFLSGGLFEPIDGYDWEHNRFEVPNELFSNKKDHKDRLADGILDIFDRYNFTMSEDEPLEREVAIDPEMLGKVFENLLDIKDRKSKGAFYTPREIVHYMCQESLINYLTNTMKVSEGAIRDFILYGDFMKDEDAGVLLRGANGGSYALWVSEELYELNDDGTIKLDRMMDLDKALQDVRVADPAVGSGAFPLGMLNEIVRARQNITTYLDITLKINDPRGASREIRYRRINERSARQLKYDTIRNCIFAVDIEPSAVDIAQLRLWLALVIDDEIDPNAVSALDGHRNPLPLPNLECNILCGNSLIDEFEGIKLINESDIIGTASNEMQVNLYQSAFDATLQRLIYKQQELFKCDDTDKKSRIILEIAELRDEVIKSQLNGATEEQLERYETTKCMASKPFVLWQLDFARVFRDNGGFDIVIGNPPYLESRNPGFSNEFKDQLQSIMKSRYGSNAGWFSRGCDLLIYFFELSLRLIKKDGINTFITQNSWLDTEFGKKFQDYLLKTTNILAIVDSDYKYFETADINTVITFMQGNRGCCMPVLFARCHKNLKYYSLPISNYSAIDKSYVTCKVIDCSEKILHEMKWGFIFATDDILLGIIEKSNKKGQCIEEIKGFSIGQGLNLRKSCIITNELALQTETPIDQLVPFFVTEESGYYYWESCSHYLAPVSRKQQYEQLASIDEVELFDDYGTRKVPPVLIMPRGIGARHFCCYNALNGYSGSCVDVYASTGIELTDDVLRLWIYFNSSLCWLIREIAGRKNLGGGMLKAEAVDLQPFAAFYPFQDIDKCKRLFEMAKGQLIQSVQDEVETDLHKEIDQMVFDYLELSSDEQIYVKKTLVEKVNSRYSKTIAK